MTTLANTPVSGNLTIAELTELVANKEIDTVIIGFTDMQGRMVGKRASARLFLEELAEHGAECCNYLLAVDVEMNTVAGYSMSSWERGYGDFVLQPDLATLRPVPWLPGTAEHDGTPTTGTGPRGPGRGATDVRWLWPWITSSAPCRAITASKAAASRSPRPRFAPVTCGGWWIITTRARPCAPASSSSRARPARCAAPSAPEASSGAVGMAEERPISARGPRRRR